MAGHTNREGHDGVVVFLVVAVAVLPVGEGHVVHHLVVGLAVVDGEGVGDDLLEQPADREGLRLVRGRPAVRRCGHRPRGLVGLVLALPQVRVVHRQERPDGAVAGSFDLGGEQGVVVEQSELEQLLAERDRVESASPHANLFQRAPVEHLGDRVVPDGRLGRVAGHDVLAPVGVGVGLAE